MMMPPWNMKPSVVVPCAGLTRDTTSRSNVSTWGNRWRGRGRGGTWVDMVGRACRGGSGGAAPRCAAGPIACCRAQGAGHGAAAGGRRCRDSACSSTPSPATAVRRAPARAARRVARAIAITRTARHQPGYAACRAGWRDQVGHAAPPPRPPACRGRPAAAARGTAHCQRPPGNVAVVGGPAGGPARSGGAHPAHPRPPRPPHPLPPPATHVVDRGHGERSRDRCSRRPHTRRLQVISHPGQQAGCRRLQEGQVQGGGRHGGAAGRGWVCVVQ